MRSGVAWRQPSSAWTRALGAWLGTSTVEPAVGICTYSIALSHASNVSDTARNQKQQAPLRIEIRNLKPRYFQRPLPQPRGSRSVPPLLSPSPILVRPPPAPTERHRGNKRRRKITAIISLRPSNVNVNPTRLTESRPRKAATQRNPTLLRNVFRQQSPQDR